MSYYINKQLSVTEVHVMTFNEEQEMRQRGNWFLTREHGERVSKVWSKIAKSMEMLEKVEEL